MKWASIVDILAAMVLGIGFGALTERKVIVEVFKRYGVWEYDATTRVVGRVETEQRQANQ